MEIELLEIRDFLAAHHPFDQLPDEVLSTIPGKLQVRYFRRGASIPESGNLKSFLYIIRTGAIELNDDEELLARLAEGDVFGYRSSAWELEKELTATAIEDCLLYQLPSTELDNLCRDHHQFGYFFEPLEGHLLHSPVSSINDGNDPTLNMMTTQIGDMISRRPVQVKPSLSIKETATIMSDERISSILITENNKLTGIVTDRDLRQRVVAAGLDFNLPVSEIMTPNPLTLDIGDYAFEALLQMAQKNIHHLPVVYGDDVRGMITITDLTKRHATSAVYLVSDIFKQTKIEALKEIAGKVPELLLQLVNADSTADSIGHIITSVTDAVTVRLIQLAELKFGPAPIPYAWIAAGSQARCEQTAKTDQDNGLILDDSFDPAIHGDYFKQFSEFVCSGLDACGYVYCPGEMMAQTDKWRQPLKTWKNYFKSWTDKPVPMSLMLTCVFFDMRCIAGEASLCSKLRKYFLKKAKGNQIFLAFMVSNALTHQTPLGFFRNFVLVKGGEHDRTFDLKHTGIIPVVDLARIYALAAGENSTNTVDRLESSLSGGEVSKEGAHDLRDALEFVGALRLEHQAEQIRSGDTADNFMSPDGLSQFERNQLKNAFSVVRKMQSVLGQRYKR